MKKVMLLCVIALVFASCAKQGDEGQVVDKWNGYQKYLKMGEQTHILWAGRNINVGTATYGIDDNANFYVTYNTTASGWKISEAHMFAGDKKNLPLNKPGNPKIGQFPKSGTYNPWVYTLTYTIPLTSLPPCAEPGFVVAAHCIVHGPNNRTETAWAEGDYKFTDKDWGWYDIYFYNQPPNQFTIIYGTAYANDSLRLYHIDVTNNKAELILREYVGSGSTSVDAAAYDVTTGMFLFVKDNNTLMVNNMKDVNPSYLSGTLAGTASSGTFYNGDYYYINSNGNFINKVTFNSDWTIASEAVLDNIPSTVAVSDVAMSPNGAYLYMIGTYQNQVQLMYWIVSSGDFVAMNLTQSLDPDAQIAFGSDGILYATSPNTTGSTAYTIDMSTGGTSPIDEDVIIIGDSFSDLSGGPIL
jgi:hypothetical protein